MAAVERDFANFRLGDNVYELADGLLPEMANVFEVDLGEQPSSEALGKLVGVIGSKKTLRDNEKGAKAWLTEPTGSAEQALDVAADWMERSGVQSALDRSLWTPDLTLADDADIILTGAVANWQDRAAKLAASISPRQVFYAVGSRVMGTATELANPNVQAFQLENGSLPSEADYAEQILAPKLVAAGHEVYVEGYDIESGDEIAARFVEQHSQLLVGDLAFARVANAGIQLAVQFRKAARELRPHFDADPNNPQVFVLTDSFPVARTEKQAANAREFQNPFTGIRQIALTAKLLVEAAAN